MVTILFFFPLRSETSMPRDCYSCSKIRNNCSVKVNIALSTSAVSPRDEFSRAVETCCDTHFTQHHLRLLPWGMGLPLPVQSYSPHHNIPLLLPLTLPRWQQRKELLPTHVADFWVIPANSWYNTAACSDGTTCSVGGWFFVLLKQFRKRIARLISQNGKADKETLFLKGWSEQRYAILSLRLFSRCSFVVPVVF